MTIRLLLTARDAAAALHLTQIALAARGDARFDVAIAAQEPAARYFRSAGLPVRAVQALAARDAAAPQAEALRTLARQLLADTRPDLALTGLSTPFDAGLDEAVLAESAVPTVLFQDFWGEQNLLLGRAADHVLAVDEEAVHLNRQRFGIESTLVGSARHAVYRDVVQAQSRAGLRAALGVPDAARLIGFFGQALHHLPGYRRTVQQFVAAVAALPGAPVRVLVRPHPREDQRQREATEALFADSGVAVVHAREGTVEDALAACDVSCSLFSTCTYDAAYLNRFATAPVTVPISMLFDPEIASYCAQHVNFETFPYHRAGVVLAVHDGDALGATLADALQPATREAVWRRAHETLPDPVLAPARALDALAAIAGRRAA
jgi:hypothetical protein